MVATDNNNNNQGDEISKEQPFSESTKIITKLLSIGGAQNVAVLLSLSTRELKMVAETSLQDVTREMRVSIDFARVLIATADNEIERRSQMLSTSQLVSLYQRAKKGMVDIEQTRENYI